MLYLDTSALIKRYVDKPGSPALLEFVTKHQIVATCLISRAEAAVAFSRAARTGSLSKLEAETSYRAFVREWKIHVRIRINEPLIARADGLAWEMGLRGYDAVHLAAALEWLDHFGSSVVVATYDRTLWSAAAKADVDRFPATL